MASKTNQEYAERLQKMIQLETVSDPKCGSPQENFEAFHDLLCKLFPNLYKVCTVQDFHGSLLLRWPAGIETDKLPILFMNHHDVVPASPDGWTHPPFSGEIADGRIWGRGTLDDKGGLWAMLEAADELAAEGFLPQRDIYFESGCNEETSGAGADEISAWLRDNGIRLEMVFDEGGDVVHSPIPGTKGTFAMVGVGEKSIVNLRFTARSSGGHASTPGKDTPLVRLGKFMAYVDKHDVFDVSLSPTITEMIKRIAPYMGPAGKVAGKADRLRKPLEKVLPKLSPSVRAILGTTIAFTLTGGGEAVNVIPREAWVVGDMRCSHHQGKEASIQAITKVAAKFDIETEVIASGFESRLTDFNGSAYRLVEEAVMATIPGVDACTPYIMTGGSDSKYFDRVCDQCIRFLPFTIDTDQMGTVHGVNECVDVATLTPAVDYFRYVMRHA